MIALFAEMARTYGVVNLVSSFGFSHRWRRACVEAVGPLAGQVCADLMCGMGEAGGLALRSPTGAPRSIECFDFCPAMTERAQRAFRRRRGGHVVRVTRGDVLSLPRRPTYHRIVCSFGLKTLDQPQLDELAQLIAALLHPGGMAAFVEMHVPPHPLLRVPYLWYLRYVIPAVGWIALGNPRCYRWLAIYTENFARRDRFAAQLATAGLQVSTRSLFGGCARLYVAHRLDGPRLAGEEVPAETAIAAR